MVRADAGLLVRAEVYGPIYLGGPQPNRIGGACVQVQGPARAVQRYIPLVVRVLVRACRCRAPPSIAGSAVQRYMALSILAGPYAPPGKGNLSSNSLSLWT